MSADLNIDEKRLNSIEDRVKDLEKQSRGQVSVWVERFMYWIIVIALIIAIIVIV